MTKNVNNANIGYSNFTKTMLGYLCDESVSRVSYKGEFCIHIQRAVVMIQAQERC